MSNRLLHKINSKEAQLAIIGLGYVGLPVACMFASVGFTVTGVDIVSERVDKINAGISPIEGDEPGLQELIEKGISSGRLHATTDYAEVTSADVVFI